ncbi:hypothetical protein [Mesorhizobium sp.]|uniref:hypothetical protein n=1 Tax=Mesorhizobium sp. TaxID=1871066 RepID=UPI0025D8D012|nr:hypothetical protein [Mesorhizobium sp.]
MTDAGIEATPMSWRVSTSPILRAGHEAGWREPIELGLQYRNLGSRFRHINVLGGCGTDHRHIEQICIHCPEAG